MLKKIQKTWQYPDVIVPMDIYPCLFNSINTYTTMLQQIIDKFTLKMVNLPTN